MKKKVFVFTLLLVAFTFGFAYAEGDAVDMADVGEDPIEVLETEETVEAEEFVEDVEVEELEEIEEEIEEIIEDVEEIIEQEEEIIEDEELEEAIDEVIELEQEAELNKVEEFEDHYKEGKEKVKEIVGIVENQYNKKKQFVANAKEAYVLTKEVEQGLKDIRYEMKEIIQDEDRKIDKETYGEIRETTENLKADVKENKYRIGNIAKETKNYIVLVKNREIRKAIRTFDNILVLQEEQLELLHIINGNVNEVKVILENA